MPDRRVHWISLAVIGGVFAAGWAFVSPWLNVPVIDDWVYASSVEGLLKTGRLHISDFSSVYPIAQILWGAAFARLAGFSFGILRLSTVVLAVMGCWAIYLSLVELGIDAVLSFLAALTIALSPMFFALSFSFMTDIPFFAVSSAALYLYISAIVRDRPSRLWWSGVLAVVAFLVRPLAAMLPLAVCAGIDWSSRSSLKRSLRDAALPLFVTVAAMAALFIAMPRWFGPLPILEERSRNLRYLALVPLSNYARFNIVGTFIAAFPFAPLLLAALGRRRRAATIAAVAAVLIVVTRFTLGEVPTPLPDFQTWSMQGIASRAGLFFGVLPPSPWSVRVMPALRIVGAVVVASLAVGGVRLAAFSFQTSAASPLERGRRTMLAFGLLHLVAINVLWFFNDRYYLALVPTLAYVAAASLMPTSVDRRASFTRIALVACPILALWAFFGFTGTREALAAGETVARMARDLEAQGIAPSDIDAGYTSNGWRLYVHPENLAPNEYPQSDVPFVTSDRIARYAIVNTPGPDDEVLKIEMLPEVTWQVSDRMYVVRRRGGKRQ